jgi:hypothetical protein
MTDKLWKSIERKVAAFLGEERVPVSGRQRGYAPDIRHKVFSIEVKHRQEFPDWMFDALEQAEQSKLDGQIPLVILHQKGQSIPDCLCVLKLSDIIKLTKEGE